MTSFHTLSKLENNTQLHLGRILVLLGAFTNDDGSGRIEGLTKLAKLDFLLRYPVYLERALIAKRASIKDLKVLDYERKSVESRMVRFRYGPWDFRYRQFLNILVAKGLVETSTEGRTVQIGLTSAGVEAARSLSEDRAFSDLARRARILKTHFDKQATYLMRFVYSTFPEIASLRWGEEIDL